jgi:hypothetical protein
MNDGTRLPTLYDAAWHVRDIVDEVGTKMRQVMDGETGEYASAVLLLEQALQSLKQIAPRSFTVSLLIRDPSGDADTFVEWVTAQDANEAVDLAVRRAHMGGLTGEIWSASVFEGDHKDLGPGFLNIILEGNEDEE